LEWLLLTDVPGPSFDTSGPWDSAGLALANTSSPAHDNQVFEFGTAGPGQALITRLDAPPG
jgi:hypothetical protein